MAPLQPQLVLQMPAPPERATTWIWAVAAPLADRRPTLSSPNRTKTAGLAASVLVARVTQGTAVCIRRPVGRWPSFHDLCVRTHCVGNARKIKSPGHPADLSPTTRSSYNRRLFLPFSAP